MFRRLAASLILAFLATGAHAQSGDLPGIVPTSGIGTTALVPVVNNEDGQFAGLMLIEPSTMPQLPSQRIIRPASRPVRSAGAGGLQLRAGLSFDANPGIGVLCNSGSVITTVGSMAGHCLLADFNNPIGRAPAGSSNSLKGQLQLRRASSQVTAGLGLRNDTLGGTVGSISDQAADRRLLTALLGPGAASLDQRDASLIGQVALGNQGWLSIGGAMAHVRIIPASQLPAGFPAQWNKGSFSLGGGYGSIGGEITGQLIDVPGQPNSFTTLGAGVTWRTPWRAKLSVGAENLVTRGKNPFGIVEAPPAANADEGRVPYVRYQQDL